MKKRKPPVAKTLLKNSIQAIYSAIEMHNKPIFPYRYEVTTILLINAWELLLKAFIYKFYDKRKAIYKNWKDWMYISLNDCLNYLAPKSKEIWIEFYLYKESISKIYEYRNNVIHAHFKELDVIIYWLFLQNIIFYTDFIKKHFKIDISKKNNLILLPLWFNKPLIFKQNAPLF